jgi:hypothetical protein
MVRSLPPGGEHAIHALHEEERKKSEKQAGDFQPQDTAGVGKRAQKSLAEGFGPTFDGRGLG